MLFIKTVKCPLKKTSLLSLVHLMSSDPCLVLQASADLQYRGTVHALFRLWLVGTIHLYIKVMPNIDCAQA